MPKDRTISYEGFDRLLAWLDPDRVRAAEKYETIRARLIRFFSCRGCFEAEELTDETIDRVIGKVHVIATAGDGGNPAAYFYGVASNIFLEWNRKRQRFSELDPESGGNEAPPGDETAERHHDCLETCLDRLPEDQRSLVLEYYVGEKSARIDLRRKLAEKYALSSNALQVKVLRIRATLRACVTGCLDGRPV